MAAQRPQHRTAVSLALVILRKSVVLAIALACTGPVNHPHLLQKSFQALGYGNLSGVTCTSPPPQPMPLAIASQSYSSCSDNDGGRTLPNQVTVSDNTIEECTSACYNAGYVLAGAEYSAECWCGSSIEAGGAPAPASDCNMQCTGNSSEYCGGPNRLNFYNYTGTPPTTSATGVNPVTGLPGNWTYNGCWV